MEKDGVGEIAGARLWRAFRSCEGGEWYSVGRRMQWMLLCCRDPPFQYWRASSLGFRSAVGKWPFLSALFHSLFWRQIPCPSSFQLLGQPSTNGWSHRSIMTLSISLQFMWTLKGHSSFRTPPWLAEALLQWLLHVSHPASFPPSTRVNFKSPPL